MAGAIGQLTTLALDLQLDYLMHPWDAFFTWMQGLIGRSRAPSNLHIELTNLNSVLFGGACVRARFRVLCTPRTTKTGVVSGLQDVVQTIDRNR